MRRKPRAGALEQRRSPPSITRSPAACGSFEASRLLNTAAATLAAGVLTDSAVEHYRAGFHNRAMFIAPAVSAAALTTATASALTRPGHGALSRAVFAASVATGVVGFGFHVTNVSRRVGGWNSENLFHAAPVAAPLAITMAGLLGFAASGFGSLLGYGVDWPLGWDDLEPYYEEAEEMLQVAGPLSYPWGRRRSRYPRRAHELNAAAIVLARGCERMGIPWSAAPIATLSSPRGLAHPCVYRGFCVIGCTTNAKQSVLVTWIPRAIECGAEIRDLSMVGRIEINRTRHATGVHYHRQGQWRFQKARQVVVAGYSIETPRLLLNSACPACPDGVANSHGLVGKYLMVHANHGVYGEFDDEIRGYKAPPSLALTEHWNYTDEGKDFHGGYLVASQGPLAREWGIKLAVSRGLWGMGLRQEMTRYNHMAGLKIVGEIEPSQDNRVELAAETDHYGLTIPKVTFSYSGNDRRLIDHAVNFMREMLESVDARNLWTENDTAHLMGGCRMGFTARDSVTNEYGRTWDIPNLWICDGSLFPTGGGVNPSLTIMAVACRIGDHIAAAAPRGDLH